MIVVTIMVILAGVSLGSFTYFQTQARDSERDNDIEAISRALERMYVNKKYGNATLGDGNVSTYPSRTENAAVFNANTFRSIGLDAEVLYAPGKNEDATTGATDAVIMASSNSLSQSPTTDQYVYQPLTQTGQLCYSITAANPCVKFNLYYQKELPGGVSVTRVSSRNQQ